jgi:hypothetical protein
MEVQHIHFHCSERNTISYILTTMSSNKCVSFVMTYDYFPNMGVMVRVHVLPIHTDRNLVIEVRVWACSYFPNTYVTARVHILPTYTDRNLVTEVTVWACSYFSNTDVTDRVHVLPTYTEISRERLGYVHAVTNTSSPKFYDKD